MVLVVGGGGIGAVRAERVLLSKSSSAISVHFAAAPIITSTFT